MCIRDRCRGSSDALKGAAMSGTGQNLDLEGHMDVVATDSVQSGEHAGRAVASVASGASSWACTEPARLQYLRQT